MQIIVLGMHRSGTSMITRFVNMLGAYFGPEKSSLGFTQDNPKGYWERREVMALNDGLLAGNGSTWDKLAAWPLERLNPATPQQNNAIRGFVLDMDAHRPWVLKDPRLCLTFDYWKPHLEVPVALVVYRNPLEVARSLENRSQMPQDYGLALWEYHAVYTLNATLGLSRIHVGHAEALRDPVNFVTSLKNTLEKHDVRGLRQPSDREILAFVDPRLYRAKADKHSMKLSPQQEMLAALMRGEVPQRAPVGLSPEAVAIIKKGL